MSSVPHALSTPGASPGRPQRMRVSLAIGVLAALLAAFVVALSGPARAADPLISQGKPALASSTENAGTPARASEKWSDR